MAQQTNGRLGWRGALAGALALGALIPVGCVFIDQVLGNDIPFVVLGAPGFLAGWIVIGILYQDEYGGKDPDVAFLLVYLMVNTALWAALWAAVIMSLRKCVVPNRSSATDKRHALETRQYDNSHGTR